MRGFPHCVGVALLAALDNPYSIFRSPVRLIELARLGIAEHDPVTDRVTLRERSPDYAELPAFREQT